MTWGNYSEENRRQLRDMVAARMFIKGARDLSDAEIERSLKGCVGQTKITSLAKIMRDEGDLTIAHIAGHLPGVNL